MKCMHTLVASSGIKWTMTARADSGHEGPSTGADSVDMDCVTLSRSFRKMDQKLILLIQALCRSTVWHCRMAVQRARCTDVCVRSLAPLHVLTCVTRMSDGSSMSCVTSMFERNCFPFCLLIIQQRSRPTSVSD